MDYSFFNFLIIFLICISLIKASLHDFRTRKIPIKTWKLAVYLSLPLSMMVFGYKIWEGYINVANPLQLIHIIMAAIVILVVTILAWKSEVVGMGGADFIAIMLITITSMAVDIYLPTLYFIFLIIFSLLFVLVLYYTKIKHEKGYKIPFLIPISLAYFAAIGFYVLNGFNAFFLI